MDTHCMPPPSPCRNPWAHLGKGHSQVSGSVVPRCGLPGDRVRLCNPPPPHNTIPLSLYILVCSSCVWLMNCRLLYKYCNAPTPPLPLGLPSIRATTHMSRDVWLRREHVGSVDKKNKIKKNKKNKKN